MMRDGGHPITRVAARIRDLRDDGFDIYVDGERYGCAVYKIPRPEPVQLPAPEVPIIDENAEQDSLFSLPPANAILGNEAA